MARVGAKVTVVVLADLELDLDDGRDEVDHPELELGLELELDEADTREQESQYFQLLTVPTLAIGRRFSFTTLTTILRCTNSRRNQMLPLFGPTVQIPMDINNSSIIKESASHSQRHAQHIAEG